VFPPGPSVSSDRPQLVAAPAKCSSVPVSCGIGEVDAAASAGSSVWVDTAGWGDPGHMIADLDVPAPPAHPATEISKLQAPNSVLTETLAECRPNPPSDNFTRPRRTIRGPLPKAGDFGRHADAVSVRTEFGGPGLRNLRRTMADAAPPDVAGRRTPSHARPGPRPQTLTRIRDPDYSCDPDLRPGPRTQHHAVASNSSRPNNPGAPNPASASCNTAVAGTAGTAAAVVTTP
jgi:hypothetical protein